MGNNKQLWIWTASDINLRTVFVPFCKLIRFRKMESTILEVDKKRLYITWVALKCAYFDLLSEIFRKLEWMFPKD